MNQTHLLPPALLALLFVTATAASPRLALAQPAAAPRAAAIDEPTGGGPAVDLDAADLEESSYDVPGQIVVDAKNDLDATAIGLLAADFGLDFKPSALERETHIELATVSPVEEAALLAALARDPRVERAEPLARVRALFAANDPLMKEQWHLDRVGASRAWDFATGRGATVAVVDTGIACETFGPYAKGSDLAETECVGGWNFVTSNEHANDDQGHGTHVAGTIAQSTNNGIGGAGVAFHARLMPVKPSGLDKARSGRHPQPVAPVGCVTAREGQLSHTMVGNRHRFLLSAVQEYEALRRVDCDDALAAIVPESGHTAEDF